MAEQEELVGGATMEEAQSFISPVPPMQAALKERKEVNGRVYFYYQDRYGGWWYDTDKGQQINKEISDWKAKKRLNR